MSISTPGHRSRHQWRLLLLIALATASWWGSAGPAGATPSTAAVFSVDGGTTWSATVNAAPGQTVLVRIGFNNDGRAPVNGSRVTAVLPAGFVRVAGSTRVCLTPGTTSPNQAPTEMVCNTDTGQGGPISDPAVWSGTHLTISPSAGLSGQSTSSTSGPLARGSRRYLSLSNCTYRSGNDRFTASISTTLLNSWLKATTTATNIGPAGPACGPGALAYTLDPAYSGVQNLPLTGQRYLTLQNCDYVAGADHYTDSISTTPGAAAFGAGTTTSNTAASAPSCGPGGDGYVPVAANSGTQTYDVAANRYLHLENCTWVYGSDYYTDSIRTTPNRVSLGARTTVSNRATTLPWCGSGANRTFAPLVSGIQDIDLSDPSRGQGWVQFAMTTPTPAVTTTYHPTSQLVAGSASPSATGSITVNPAIGTPMGDPLILLPVGLAAALGAVPLARRHRRTRENLTTQTAFRR